MILFTYFLQALRRYAEFKGRSTRTEYWWFFGMSFLIYSGFDLLAEMGYGGTTLSWITGIFTVGMLVPSLAIGTRRLHDTDRSGWWLNLMLIPVVGACIVVILSSLASTDGPNRYGPKPVNTL